MLISFSQADPVNYVYGTIAVKILHGHMVTVFYLKFETSRYLSQLLCQVMYVWEIQ